MTVLRTLSLAAITALAIYLCWLMSAPFLSAFTWAFALAVAFSPVRTWLSRRLSRAASTLVIISAVIIAIAVPGTIVSRQLFQESVRAQQLLQDSIKLGYRPEFVSRWPQIGTAFIWINQQLDLGQIGQQLAGSLARSIAPAVARSVNTVSQVGVTILTLFFFLQDQEISLSAIRALLPFPPLEIDHLFNKIGRTIQATVYGRILIGSIQGVLGGLLFASVGLPAAALWGTLMILLSMLPVFGAFLVWIPASIVLFAQGHWVRALVVLVGGVVVIHPVDNFLYPIFVGSRVGLHPLILFIAFVGGLIVFGPAGLILGPCIVAAATALAEIWQSRSTGAPLPLSI